MSHRTALHLVPANTSASQPPAPDLLDEAVDAFLAGYHGETLRNYRYHLDLYFDWCDRRDLHPFDARRPDLRAYLGWLQDTARRPPNGWSQSTVQIRITAVCVFYRECVIDEYLQVDPAVALKRPDVDRARQKRTYLKPLHMARWLAAAAEESPDALLLGLLLGECGLRISEACALDLEDLGVHRGYDTATIVGKGNKVAVIPIPVPVMRVLTDTIAGRTSGPLLLNKRGRRMTRSNATHLIRKVAAAAGVSTDISPHTFRRVMITTALQMGIPIHKVQVAARHASINTTMIYNSYDGFDDHATHTVAGFYSQFT